MATAKPTAKFMDVSPDTASAWLERNTKNRRIRNRTVDGYVRDMEMDRWEVTGEGICFGVDGVLLDGQHRLLACVRSGRTFHTLVCENVSGQANHDGGPRRTLRDALMVREVKYADSVGAAVRIVAYYELAKKNLDPSRRPVTLTLADYMVTFDKRAKKFEAEAKESNRLYQHSERVISPGWYTGLHLLFARANVDAADYFRLRVYDGHHLGTRSPIHQLRRQFMQQRPGDRLTPRERLALTIKAFNASAGGRDSEGIAWRASGPRAEAFPEIVGTP